MDVWALETVSNALFTCPKIQTRFGKGMVFGMKFNHCAKVMLRTFSQVCFRDWLMINLNGLLYYVGISGRNVIEWFMVMEHGML